MGIGIFGWKCSNWDRYYLDTVNSQMIDTERYIFGWAFVIFVGGVFRFPFVKECTQSYLALLRYLVNFRNLLK